MTNGEAKKAHRNRVDDGSMGGRHEEDPGTSKIPLDVRALQSVVGGWCIWLASGSA